MQYGLEGKTCGSTVHTMLKKSFGEKLKELGTLNKEWKENLLEMMTYTCNPSAQEAETEVSPV